MNRESATRLVAPFYDALNPPASKDVAALVESVASLDWRSYSGEGVSKGRDEFVNQVRGFGKLIPDLAWTIKDVFADGERIIVRSEASGTPASDFMGVPHSGKRFAIMTIDIHTVRDGNLVAAHHVEDWASALRQLAAK
jgi:predicted ester cyclase